MPMEQHSTKTKRIVKNSLMLYVRLFVHIIVGLYASRITLEALGVDDFGIYNLVGGIIVVMNFISNAMALSINRFLSFSIGRNDNGKASEVFSMAMNIHIILCVLVLLIGESVGLWFINTQLVIPEDRMFAANIVFQASLVSFSLQVFSVPYNSDIIAHEHIGYLSLTSIIQTLAKLFAALSLYLHCFDDADKLVLYTLFMVVPFVAYFLMNVVYCKRKFKEATYRKSWSWPLFKEMASFAGFSTFGNMATALVNLGQSILLNIFYGPALNTVRGLSLQVNAAIQSFAGGIYTAVNPQIIKSYAQGDMKYFNQLVCQSTKIAYFMLFTLSLPLVLEINPVLSLWLKDVPEYTPTFVRLILINSLFYNFVTPSWMAIQATGKVAVIHLTTGCINLCNLLVTYVLWKTCKTEPYVIVVVNIAVSAMMQVATIFIQHRQIPLRIKPYAKNVILPVCAFTIIASIFPIAVYVNMEEGVLRFILVCFLSLICSATTFFVVCVDKELKAFILKYVKSKVHRFANKQHS